MEENKVISLNLDDFSADEYEIQSELNDMRQHANKIIQGIKKLDNNDSERAIWELFQNAVDLSEECHIHIKLTDSTFEFRHNGEAFTPMTLDCLFKQVSSKTLEEKKQVYNHDDAVGQYGTGFITTHVFGKELQIEGALIKGDGLVPLRRFTIDRSTDNWRELAQNIRLLKKDVISLLKEEQQYISPVPDTTFIYQTATKRNKDCANDALEALRLILPFVMALNPKLISVIVTETNGNQTLYGKKASYFIGPILVKSISINDTVQEICTLEGDQGDITIILPLTTELRCFDFNDRLPKLFLYYPLIGTQHFGINFIINSRQFQPTEPRNGLFLKSDNDATKKEEETNQFLIQQASKLVFDFVLSNADKFQSPIKLVKINFKINGDDPFLDKYFENLKVQWIDQFKKVPLVETREGNIAPLETLFFHQELLLCESSLSSIVKLTGQFWTNIPQRHIIKEWTEKIDEWAIPEIKFICIIDILEKIQETGELGLIDDPDALMQFYGYIIDQGRADLFNSNKVIPNIKGEFRQLSGNEGLNNSINLSKELIDIADVIMPDVPKRHVHPDFKFNLEFVDYSRRSYTTEINERIASQVGDKVLGCDIPRPLLMKLLDYCKVSSTIESHSIPTQVVKLICKYYEYAEDTVIISGVKDDELDLRPSQKRLIRIFLNELSNREPEWTSENIDFLKNVIAIGSNYESYEELFLSLTLYPNQLDELCLQSLLWIDDSIPVDIKNLYDAVLGPDLPIRASLVNSEFEQLLKNKQIKTTRDLTEKLESNFFNDQSNHSINDHLHKKEILGIIEKIKNSADYEKYFPLIFSKRSSILVDLADGDDTFSILSLDPARIKKLAELGAKANLDEIIKLGEEAVLKQLQEKANFQHKFTIGTHIEKILRERLSLHIAAEIHAEIEDEQNGQDIIIKIDGIPVYYIEVKSRWDVSSPIRMSRNQTLKADEQKDKYALCFVDMTKFLGTDKYQIIDISEIEHCIVLNTTIGYEVTHLISVLNQTNEPETIHLDGDYRTLVPIKFMDKGLDLVKFEKFLSEYLTTNVFKDYTLD